MIQAFFFDMDGVLTDTSEFHYLSWQRLADEEGIPFKRKDNEALLGLTRGESLQKFLAGRKISDEQTSDWLERKNRYFLEYVQFMTPTNLLPGVDPLIDEIRAAGLKIAVVSSSKNTTAVLERLQLWNRVDTVTDPNLGLRGKPEPDLFLRAAQDLSVAPRDCLVVEDSAAGIQAGKAAGMRTLGLGPSQRVGAADVVLPSLEGIALAFLLDALEPDR